MVKPSVLSIAEPKSTTSSSQTWLSRLPEKPDSDSAAFQSRALNRLDDFLPQLVHRITGMPLKDAQQFNNVQQLLKSQRTEFTYRWLPQLTQALQKFCQEQFGTSLASLLKNPPAPRESVDHRGPLGITRQVLSRAPDTLPLPLVGNLGGARAVVHGVKSAINTRPRTVPKDALFATVKAKNSQGLTVVAQIEAQRSSINGRLQITAYVVKQVSTYSDTPITPAQKRHSPDTEGYHVSTVGKNNLVIDAYGGKITDVAKAKDRVLETIRHDSLTTNTDEQVKTSQISRARQQKINGQLATQIQASGPQKIGPWTPPIPLSKAVKHMSVEEKLEYSIRVAIKFAPAEVGKQLKSLLSPLSLAIMAGFAASHAVGVGQVADIVGALLLGKQAIEVGVKFIDFMKTAITAEDAMTLTDAGRTLSQVGAELFTTGLSVLGAIGLKKVAGQFKTRRSPEPINSNTPVLLENNRVKTIQTQLNTKTGLYEPVVESPSSRVHPNLKPIVEHTAIGARNQRPLALQMQMSVRKNQGSLTQAIQVSEWKDRSNEEISEALMRWPMGDKARLASLILYLARDRPKLFSNTLFRTAFRSALIRLTPGGTAFVSTETTEMLTPSKGLGVQLTTLLPLLSGEQKKILANQLAEDIARLHSNDILLRNLTPQNLSIRVMKNESLRLSIKSYSEAIALRQAPKKDFADEIKALQKVLTLLKPNEISLEDWQQTMEDTYMKVLGKQGTKSVENGTTVGVIRMHLFSLPTVPQKNTP